MTSVTASGQPSDLVRPFQTADTIILDERAARVMQERLELHRLAIQVLRGQGRDHGEARWTVSQLTDDELWAVLACAETPRPPS
jgi:hypothetical protein